MKTQYSWNTTTLETMQKLEAIYGQSRYFLHARGPLQVLVATMLSAQTTDAQVNRVLPQLFSKYKTARDFASASGLEQDIKSIGLYKTKARNIRKACAIIENKSDGRVPDIMDGLLELPGVGRKTANVVLAHAFGKVEGITVDTHVARLSGRLGWSAHKDREKIERELMEKIPKEKWADVTYLLISHGRAVCSARRPKCSSCVLNKTCPSAFKA